VVSCALPSSSPRPPRLLPHPVPLSIHTPTPQIAFPDGVPAESYIASKDVNGIQVPMSAQPKGMQTVLIDFAKKTAE
jgi:hypothetical protein